MVIKGTNEEAWYNTSTVNKNYIEITENELDDILNGREIQTIVQEGKEENLLFRI